MSIKKFSSWLALCLISTGAAAQDTCSAAEQSFLNAVGEYSKNGATAFMGHVLKNGPLEGDKRSLSQVQTLGQIEQFFGSLSSASIISKKALGEKTCYLVAVLEYSKGPLFTVATYYKGNKGIAGTSMFFKTEPEAIIPKELLVGAGLNK